MQVLLLNGRIQLTSVVVCCASIFFTASAALAAPPDTKPTEKTTVSADEKGKQETTPEEGKKSEEKEEKNAFAGKIIDLKAEKSFSVSRNFMKLFDKSKEQDAQTLVLVKQEEPVVVTGDGISITKPNGWAQVYPDDPNVVLAFEEAGNPTNRIEIRRGFEIAPSRFDQYLDSFRTMLENAGFETTLTPNSGGLLDNSTTSDSAPSNISVPFLEKHVGGLHGQYLRYRVASVDVSSLLRGQKKTGLLLFLYEGRNAPWIFVAFSTSGELDRLQPLFEDILRSAQFDIAPAKKSRKP